MSNAYLGRTTEIEAQIMFYTVYRPKMKGEKIQCLTHLIPNLSLQNKCMYFTP